MTLPAPGAAMTLAGKNCVVIPVGSPATVNVTAALKVEFGAVVSVKVLDALGAMLIVVAEEASVKLGTGATVRVSGNVCLVAPLLPATDRE